MSFNRVVCVLCVCSVFVGLGRSCFSAGFLKNTGNELSEDAKYVEKKIIEGWKVTEGKVLDGWYVVKSGAEKEWDVVKHEIDTIKIEGACTCGDNRCGCCAHFEEPTIHLNSTFCTNVAYLAQDYGVSWSVTVDKHAIYNETMSLRNPPPVCLGVPHIEEFMSCIRLHDLDVTTKHFHACVTVEVRVTLLLLAKYDFGCIDIKSHEKENGAFLTLPTIPITLLLALISFI